MEKNEIYRLKTKSNNEEIIKIEIKEIENKLEIKAFFEEDYIIKTYIGNFSLEVLKNQSNYFTQFDDIKMLIQEMKHLNNNEIIVNEENDKLSIIFKIDSLEYPTIEFILNLKKKSDKEKLEEYDKILKLLKDKLLIRNFNSKIIKNKIGRERIKMWISPFKNLESKLLYSYYDIKYKFQNEFNPIFEINLTYLKDYDFKDVNSFHQKCDNKSNILVICKSKNEIFGGFTPLSFSNNNSYGYDNDSFIFSINKLKKCTKLEQHNSCSIWRYKNYGPCFSYDLCFKENSMNKIKIEPKKYYIFDNFIDKNNSIFDDGFYYLNSLEIFQINFI